MNKLNNHWKPLTVAFLYTSLCAVPVWADDTEIYSSNRNAAGGDPVNVLFIIDTSGSMDEPLTGESDKDNNKTTGGPNRMDAVKQVINEILYAPGGGVNPEFSGKNLALMRFDNTSGNAEGGSFLTGFLRLSDTNATTLSSQVQSLSPSGSTPLAETFLEAALFYQGKAPKYGNTANPPNVCEVKDNVDGLYISPFNTADITNSCSTAATTTITESVAGSMECATNNHVIILTDGAPNKDSTNTSDLTTYLTGYPTNPDTASPDYPVPAECAGDKVTGTKRNCLPNIAEYLYKTDFDSNRDGIQNVMTNTIAFDLSQDSNSTQFLADTAAAGGGKSFEADSIAGLSAAIRSILSEIQIKSGSFVAPSVSVDSNNRLVHNNTMYFGMFKPEQTELWNGNIKAYRLQDDKLVDFTSPNPLDVLNNDGTLNSDSKSKWSSAADGNDVTAGGLATSMLSQGVRKVITFLGTDRILNEVTETNANITSTMLNVTDATRVALLQWARGVDAYDEDGDTNTTEMRHFIGDPLHFQPILLEHSDGNSYLFFGTNQGFLHAVDVTTGTEKFAFIPQGMLGKLKTLSDNLATSTRTYGIDGNAGAARINGKTYIYFGSRRGDRNYYALDVSDMANPVLAWTLEGGNNDFPEMGQSWAAPVVSKVRINNVDKAAIIVSGGYDEGAEDTDGTGTKTMGRAVYIVDAETGAKIWSATGGTAARSGTELVLPELTNSIPATIATLDKDLDGFTDRLYFADVAGQLFRVDLDAVTTDTAGAITGTNIPNGGVIANLRGSDPADQRKFFNEVEIVFTKFGAKHYISLNVGSGNRDNPLGTSINDAFYSVRDDSPYAAPHSYSTITVTDLMDITSGPVDMNSLLGGTIQGWKLPMSGSGEKVLSDSYTLNNKLMFTTYTPAANTNTNSCQPTLGTAKMYVISLFDGSAVLTDRAVELKNPGIPASPAVVFSNEGTNANPGINVLVGMENVSNLQLQAVLQKAPNWEVNPPADAGTGTGSGTGADTGTGTGTGAMVDTGTTAP
ncbi:MAG: PilC/PilY family type IV pilus protein [Gammaproteobacteria bacterium]|nr:PilC/PilY family type IV pilus protein [Gammaproteobacteria bacterium]MDH5803083.1 PilC/PilY family type IV pilus protein [Gammaproteobacteria bacterium]